MKYPLWIVDDIRKKKRDFYNEIKAIETDEDLKEYRANTICYEAKCPNKGKCFSQRHATFLILGTVCSRACKFCSVEKGKPLPPDPDEPLRVASLVGKWNLKYVVFTSPTRDDLEDGGAEHYKKTIIEIRKNSPQTIVEPLIPDFGGNLKLVDIVIEANPDVISHNIEMVERLYPEIRPGSLYKRSLLVLKHIKEKKPSIITKSSIIIGLGEDFQEIKKTLKDLKENLVDIVVIGQYLNPTDRHYPIKKFYTPLEFKELETYAQSIGFKSVVSSPLARTSYQAHKAYLKLRSDNGEDIFS